MTKQKSTRCTWLVALLALGSVVALIVWMFSVTAYGYDVDARGQVGGVRLHDVLLLAAAASSATAAIVLAVRCNRRPPRQRRDPSASDQA